MFKKPLASLIAAAVLAAGSGDLAAASAAQATTRGPVAGVSVIPAIGTGLNNHAPSASFSNAPTPTLTILTAPAPQSAPGIAAPAMEESSPLAVIQSRDARVGVAEKGEALNALFDDTLATGHQAIETLGPSALSDGKAMKPGLSRPGAAARAAGGLPAAAPAPV
ncbi:MAG: hypothetical protein HY403_09495, partial [Elusimicrobia bacterium]|nr:hypothetical protein [Elusimicrobiota bacterium]